MSVGNIRRAETLDKRRNEVIMSVQGESSEKVRERTGTDVREPRHYKVIMHNDDFTSMEFVVEILMDIFHKNGIEAERLMLMVHKSGKAVVGAYPYDIAVTKVQMASARARKEGFPFRLTVEA